MTAPTFVVGPIWTLEKRGGVVLAGEREYKGSRFFELRQWAGDGTVPTKHGVTIPPDEVEALARAMLDYTAAFSQPVKT